MYVNEELGRNKCSYSSLYNYFHKYVTIYNFIAGRIKNISLAHAEFGSVVGLSDDPTGLFVSPFCHSHRSLLSLLLLLKLLFLVFVTNKINVHHDAGLTSDKTAAFKNTL